jgi:hypothetical protein
MGFDASLVRQIEGWTGEFSPREDPEEAEWFLISHQKVMPLENYITGLMEIGI